MPSGQKKQLKPLALAISSLFLATFGVLPFSQQIAAASNTMTSSSTNTTTGGASTSGAVSSPVITTKTTTVSTTPDVKSSATTTPPANKTTVTTSNVSPEKMPVDQPNMTDEAMINWATDAARSAYSYDFKNYAKQLQMNQQNFTAAGWTAFMAALNKSNNLQVVQNKKLVASATPNGKATIIKKGVQDGVYTWKLQVPMLATYESESRVIKQNLVITMLIDRTNSNNGIGISHFVATLVPANQTHPTNTAIPGASTATSATVGAPSTTTTIPPTTITTPAPVTTPGFTTPATTTPPAAAPGITTTSPAITGTTPTTPGATITTPPPATTGTIPPTTPVTPTTPGVNPGVTPPTSTGGTTGTTSGT